mmetsp:Transcript_45502/g.49172  ORF Transcript_45502/g.49172 Transcript_45502/m.49172 type:complete len:83 (+) Transcript_45502:469-717(+)
MGVGFTSPPPSTTHNLLLLHPQRVVGVLPLSCTHTPPIQYDIQRRLIETDTNNPHSPEIEMETPEAEVERRLKVYQFCEAAK